MGHALAGNLLFDGDFEMTRGQDKGLSPWLKADSTGQSSDIALETGGLCRSGLLCGRLKPNELAIALGASANTVGMDVSVQIRPLGAAPTCDNVAVSLVNCLSLFSGIATKINLSVEAASAPDAQGWCQFHNQIGAQIDGLCLVIQNQTADDLLIDDAAVTASAGSPPMLHLAGPKPPSPPSQRLTEAVQRALPSLAKRLQPRPVSVEPRPRLADRR
jgi:hypothetical protein